jgi:putative cell wall-binding protein
MRQVDAAAGTVRRLQGRNRYETAAAIAQFGCDERDMAWDRVALATGTNFPDALAGGVLQGMDGSVMLLTAGTSLSTPVAAKLAANRARIWEIRYLGSTAAVSDDVRFAAKAILRP